jgi:hypothetical protein
MGTQDGGGDSGMTDRASQASGRPLFRAWASLEPGIMALSAHVVNSYLHP